MRYQVTYQVDGDEHTDEVDAPDAAAAASSVRQAHQSASMFELILVHLVDIDEAGDSHSGLESPSEE